MVDRIVTRFHPLALAARCISGATQPTVTIIPLLMAFNGIGVPNVSTWRWLVWCCVTITCAATLPSIAFLVMLKRGIISDLYVSDRSERPLAYVLMIPPYIIGTELARLVGAPHHTILLMAAAASCLIVAALVNARVFKISIHTMSAALLAVSLVMVYGPRYGAFVLLVPLVWWARVWLRAHTPGEATAGMIVGAAVGFLMFALL